MLAHSDCEGNQPAGTLEVIYSVSADLTPVSTGNGLWRRILSLIRPSLVLHSMVSICLTLEVIKPRRAVAAADERLFARPRPYRR